MQTNPNEPHLSNTCTAVAARDLCVGCGTCAGLCPTDNLKMDWTSEGMLHPVDQRNCKQKCTTCLQVCPFVDHSEDEDSLAAAMFAATPGMRHDPVLGYHLHSFVGYAVGRYREEGASGGLASWILASLLSTGEIDHAVCVQPRSDPQRLFTYEVCSTADEIRSASGSAYYPVELSDVLRTIRTVAGRYALVGLPCFLKAVRLAMRVDAELRDRVSVLVGLVCGQLKSRGFTEYLIRAAGLDPQSVRAVTFRDKDPGRPALHYHFKASDGTRAGKVAQSGEYGKAWHSGEFSLRPCDFCDDVFAEVADVTCMDAWLDPYRRDGRGTSICVVRSTRVLEFLREGIAAKELTLSDIPSHDVLASQAPVTWRKRELLAYRLGTGDNQDQPKKRVVPAKPPARVRRQLAAREQVRLRSPVCLAIQARESAEGLDRYNELMRPYLENYMASLRPPFYRRYPAAARRRLRRLLLSSLGRNA